MKTKTINSVISRKVDAWLASIDDVALRERVAKNTIVTGGSIVSMLLREPVNDYDIYLRDPVVLEDLAKYYVKRFEIRDRRGIPCPISVQRDNERVRIIVKSAGVASEQGTEIPYQYFEGEAPGTADRYLDGVMTDPGEIEEFAEETKELIEEQKPEKSSRPKYRPVFLSTNAITLADGIQVVLRFCGEPEVIHKYYDFVHCTCYWTSWDRRVVLNAAAMESMLTKELRYVGSLYPVCSLFRVRKFVKRGWSITAGQMLKIIMQASRLDLSNRDVLEDQLTGVDVAYFRQLINLMSSDGKEGVEVDHAYIISLIDRLY